MDREKILNYLIVFWFILMLIMILWYTFGHSPTVDQILIMAVVSPYLLIFTIYERFNRRVNDVYEKLNDRISQTREDFHKEFGEIKSQLGKIDGKVSRKKRR